MRACLLTALLVLVLVMTPSALAGEREIQKGMTHLRVAGEREWAEFPAQPESGGLTVTFPAAANAAEQTLWLRQQNVKQTWKVLLNNRELGRLHGDENDIIACFAIPAATLKDGENTLSIEQGGHIPDDVRIGQIRLDDRPRDAVLAEASIVLEIRDEQSSSLLPCRVTVLNAEGALQTVGAASNDSMAVRHGVIYCNGQAAFGVPAGEYTICVGRGFEYGLKRLTVSAAAGSRHRLSAQLLRQVPTGGWIACDTHVHTLTHSGHGDATIDERMLTIAGEGLELPIATDHNVHVDYEPVARRLGLREFFTPVIGNEVTTKVGHFNVFPIAAGAAPPDHRPTDWDSIFRSIYGTPDVKVCILNHARDIHSGVRPFGPKLHNALVGENLSGWRLQANAMEIVNSSAQQTDIMRLIHDWFGMLNRGHFLTPVGGSDSHDVARHFVGQGRTYIRVDDRDPGNIDVAAAVDSFRQGRVVVSLGLFTEIEVSGQYGPGDVVPASAAAESVQVRVRVLRPDWTAADVVELYANGRKIRSQRLARNRLAPPSRGLEETPANAEAPEGRAVPAAGGDGADRPLDGASGLQWTLDDLPSVQDVFLVAVARGPGVRELYWPIARPYQPKSPEWTPHVLSVTGAVWLDRDGDGRRTPAREYAERIVKTAAGDLAKTLAALEPYDEAVAAHAAHLLHQDGVSWTGASTTQALETAAPAVQQGVRAYLEAWRATEIARSER